MEDDSDIEMAINAIPSQVYETSYLFYPSVLPNPHGKWMFFVPKGTIQDMYWEHVKLFFQSTPQTLLFAKTSTMKPHSHAAANGLGVIMVFCEHGLPEKTILETGNNLSHALQYTSLLGKVYYKTEAQSHPFVRTEARKNHSFSLPVPRPVQTVLEKPISMPQAEQICVYSLNLWMNPVSVVERMLFVFQDIENIRPDVLMFQEVTLKSYCVLNELLRSIGFATRSILKEDTKRFSEMLYFNTQTIEALDFEQSALLPESTMRREIHILRAFHKATTKRLHFATAHLEPGEPRKEMRERQFRYLQVHLEHKMIPWIFAGDTNMAYYQNSTPLTSFTHDAWEQTHQKIKHFGTWDPRKNTNLQKIIAPHVAPCRFDRVLFQNTSLLALDFQLSCQGTIPLLGNMHASDHFAIVSKFQFLLDKH